MTNEEVMQLMTDMGLHEGGIENWIMDNAWVLVVNKAIEKEREAYISHAMTSAEKAIDVAIKLEREACANICEEEQGYKTAFCALKIRARGKA